jgi:hypothetical protein
MITAKGRQRLKITSNHSLLNCMKNYVIIGIDALSEGFQENLENDSRLGGNG